MDCSSRLINRVRHLSFSPLKSRPRTCLIPSTVFSIAVMPQQDSFWRVALCKIRAHQEPLVPGVGPDSRLAIERPHGAAALVRPAVHARVSMYFLLFSPFLAGAQQLVMAFESSFGWPAMTQAPRQALPRSPSRILELSDLCIHGIRSHQLPEKLPDRLCCALPSRIVPSFSRSE